MGRCGLCGKEGREVSGTIGFCGPCVRDRFQQVWPRIKLVHDANRASHGLPPDPPRDPGGVPCRICMHQCIIPEGGVGYCGVRRARGGRLEGGWPCDGEVSWYHDPLPTNCVADWVCPGGTGCGFPRYAVTPRTERGYFNLAVFYHACSFNCLFCQNHHYRELTRKGASVSYRQLGSAVQERTNCICFFGGDPTPQVLHAVKAARLARANRVGQILRICWETNLAVREPFLTEMVHLSMESGGCIKVDIKAWDPGIHMALCGVENSHTIENFVKLASLVELRPEPPLLVASTLLVPGYVDKEEVGAIASFLAGLNPGIPYSLLAFYPSFWLSDLPPTSREHAKRCLDAARGAGLSRVRLGNVSLLGNSY